MRNLPLLTPTPIEQRLSPTLPIEVELLTMLTLGILVLLLLLTTNWIVQGRTVAVWAGESGSCQTSAREVRRGKVLGICVEQLLAPEPICLAVKPAGQLVPAHFQDSTLWKHEPTQFLRGLDLCRCTRDFKERLLPCLFLPML